MEIIKELAEKLDAEASIDINHEVKKISKNITLKEMKSAVDLYLMNAVYLSHDSMAKKEMSIILMLCLEYGEDICKYIDKTAFGAYDWTQYEAIDLLCKMALLKGVRKNETLKLINTHIDGFRYESLMNSLVSIRGFQNEPIVQDIFERQIGSFKDNHTDLVHILQFYWQSNKNRFEKYLQLLKTVVFENEIYPLSMAYIFKANKEGDMIAYNKDGSKYDAEESVEFLKIKAAIMFYETNSNDSDINNYLTYLKTNSKFRHHRDYLKDFDI